MKQSIARTEKKATHVAIAPDGTRLTRKSDRIYTHAVLVHGEQGWGVISFNGSEKLAQAQKKSWDGYNHGRTFIVVSVTRS